MRSIEVVLLVVTVRVQHGHCRPLTKSSVDQVVAVNIETPLAAKNMGSAD